MLEVMKRACAAVLLLALAWPVVAQAKKNVPRQAGETIHWVAPWREGVTLRYASEDYDVSAGANGRERARTTSTETIRIIEARDDGFVQEWSWADSRYEQLEGREEQQVLMQQLMDSLPGLTLEVDLDATGNFVALRNIDDLAARLRPALRKGFDAIFESGIQSAGGWPAGEAEAAEARARGQAVVDGMLERMTSTPVLAALMSSDAVAYNDAFGAELEAGVPFEVEVEIESPLGGSAPARVTLLMQAGAPGSDEATLEWVTRMDREKMAAMALAAVEQMYGVGVSDEDRAKVAADMSLTDAGSVRFRRSTGVPLMLETVRTVGAAGEQRVERRRMRLLDDDHGHAWPDDVPFLPADPDAPG